MKLKKPRGHINLETAAETVEYPDDEEIEALETEQPLTPELKMPRPPTCLPSV